MIYEQFAGVTDGISLKPLRMCRDVNVKEQRQQIKLGSVQKLSHS